MQLYKRIFVKIGIGNNDASTMLSHTLIGID
jgi:hypothetical protein